MNAPSIIDTPFGEIIRISLHRSLNPQLFDQLGAPEFRLTDLDLHAIIDYIVGILDDGWFINHLGKFYVEADGCLALELNHVLTASFVKIHQNNTTDLFYQKEDGLWKVISESDYVVLNIHRLAHRHYDMGLFDHQLIEFFESLLRMEDCFYGDMSFEGFGFLKTIGGLPLETFYDALYHDCIVLSFKRRYALAGEFYRIVMVKHQEKWIVGEAKFIQHS